MMAEQLSEPREDLEKQLVEFERTEREILRQEKLERLMQKFPALAKQLQG